MVRDALQIWGRLGRETQNARESPWEAVDGGENV